LFISKNAHVAGGLFATGASQQRVRSRSLCKVTPFRHNAFTAELAGVGEESLAIAL
jgi:hypothetical protein